MSDWIIISSVTGIYLLIVLIVGIAARRGQKSTLEGYITGGRSVGIVVLFFILGAEIFSAFTFLGAPGQAFTTGAPALYILAYLSLALILWWVIGPRVATLGRRYGYLSQADLFADRFSSKSVPVVMSIMSVVALIPYLTIQITGAGLLFTFATDGQVPFWLGSLVAFAICTIYVFVSGLKGIGWTNLLQGILMLVVAWAIGIAAVFQLFGTVDNMFSDIREVSPEYLIMPGGGDGWTWAAFSSAIVLSVLGFVMWPHVFNKSYSAESNRHIKRTVVLYPLYALLVVPILLAGFAAITTVQEGDIERPDAVMSHLIVNLLDLPPIVIGLMLAGAVAAAMSTGANLAHTAASIVVRDFISHVKKEALKDSVAVSITKWCVVIISALAFILAVLNVQTIVQLFLIAYGIVIQFLPITFATLFWRRATFAGVMSGMLAGLGVTIYFTFVQPTPFDIEPGLWGVAVNTICLVMISLFTKPMAREHTERFVRPKASTEIAAQPELSRPVTVHRVNEHEKQSQTEVSSPAP
ncbi:sodium:solute symporter family protein [Enteractinococcus helveticum]|uniref:sodium:solute symporter family protein n=1 Tax=Enteractinococcus helveticum TaxID=1837282 RepID=UPI00082F41AC|nr:sodium:solute symporter family protein [Enteractinococcus helveticum]